jgi:hypothetical protein
MLYCEGGEEGVTTLLASDARTPRTPELSSASLSELVQFIPPVVEEQE